MEEDFLSPELREALGDNCDAVLASNKKKQKRPRSPPKAPEEVKEIERLSKRAKKKLEQLKNKKEKEEKRSSYYEVLEKNAITQSQQNILLSTREVGQTQTTKQRLKRLLLKHKAGLELTAEEKALLFPSEIPPMPLSAAITTPQAEATASSKEIATPASSSSIAPATQGKNLLEQFRKLKNAPRPAAEPDVVPAAPPSNASVDPGHVIITPSQLHTSEAPTSKYVPIPIAMPDPSALHGSSRATALSSSKHTPVYRDDAIQMARLQLPVCGMEQEIVEAITENDVVILCGETGSGKSTQVPQFLYEAGYTKHGRIGITQPRRVAAVSTANRVAVEMGALGKQVGYQIRHESKVNEGTVIKFMTDGVLLREVAADLLLPQYSVIIIDEAHERNVNTDVLLGMLSRSIRLRRQQVQDEEAVWKKLSEKERQQYAEPCKPLRLVVMSATLRVSDFQSPHMFNPSPVEARQYPVTTHFSKRTETKNYLEEVYRKTCLIHKRLPEGGVLVFLTGKREILHMCRKLNKALNKTMRDDSTAATDDLEEAPVAGDVVGNLDSMESTADALCDDGTDWPSSDDSDRESDDEKEEPVTPSNAYDLDEVYQRNRDLMLREALNDDDADGNDEGSVLPAELNNTAQTDVDTLAWEEEMENKPKKVLVLPLFAMLSPEQQAKVFAPPPAGHRLIVVATNVAETSITIPGIKYVVDCGRQKERYYDVKTGISRYQVSWISKASADQRAGRAGRTAPGHCYRLYSSAFYDQHLCDFQAPEIESVPLEDLVLQMMSIGLESLIHFPFPSPPPLQSLLAAQSLLMYLGAIKRQSEARSSSGDALGRISELLDGVSCSKSERLVITPLGKKIARYPINVRYAKMLVVASKVPSLCLDIVFPLVAVLSERSPFLRLEANVGVTDESDSSDDDDDEALQKDTPLWKHSTSDVLASLRALGAYIHCKNSNQSIEDLCSSLHLHQATLHKCDELRSQLQRIAVMVSSAYAKTQPKIGAPLVPPAMAEETALRQIMTTGFCDCVARRVPVGTLDKLKLSRRKRLTVATLRLVRLFISTHTLRSIIRYAKARVNRSDVNQDPTAKLPEYVLYSQLISNQVGDTTYMTGVTAIEGAWLASDCPLLQWSEPMSSPSPYYDKKDNVVMCHVSPLYGIHKWELPAVTKPMTGLVTLDPSDKALIGYRKQDVVQRWFLRLMLEGKVFTEPAELVQVLKPVKLKESASAATDLKPHKKVMAILNLLVASGIDSIPSLFKKLKADKSYLTAELQALFSSEYRSVFRTGWAKLAALAAAQN